MTERLRSYEILQDTILRDGEEVARNCGLSTILIRKWKEPNGDYTDSGAYNPLDRLVCIIETIKKIDPVRAFLPFKWLAGYFGFILVPIPKPIKDVQAAQHYLMSSIKEFGHLAEASVAALADGKITPEEARKVLAEGYELQEAVGSFLYTVERSVDRG